MQEPPTTIPEIRAFTHDSLPIACAALCFVEVARLGDAFERKIFAQK
jgi:hypothetical protein